MRLQPRQWAVIPASAVRGARSGHANVSVSASVAETLLRVLCDHTISHREEQRDRGIYGRRSRGSCDDADRQQRNIRPTPCPAKAASPCSRTGQKPWCAAGRFSSAPVLARTLLARNRVHRLKDARGFGGQETGALCCHQTRGRLRREWYFTSPEPSTSWLKLPA